MSKAPHRLSKLTVGLGRRCNSVHGRHHSAGSRHLSAEQALPPGEYGSFVVYGPLPESAYLANATGTTEYSTRFPATSSQVQLEDFGRKYNGRNRAALNLGKHQESISGNDSIDGKIGIGSLYQSAPSTRVQRLPRSETPLSRNSIRRSPSPGSSSSGSPFSSTLFGSPHSGMGLNHGSSTGLDALQQLLLKFGVAGSNAHFHTSAKYLQTPSPQSSASEFDGLPIASSALRHDDFLDAELNHSSTGHGSISSASHAWTGDNIKDHLVNHNFDLNEGNKHQYILDHGAYGIPKRANGPLDHVSTFDAKGTRTGSGNPATDLLSTQVGEDAFFLSSDALGIADGVGGWRRHAPSKLHGLSTDPNAPDPRPDPGMFSLLLTHHMRKELARMDNLADPRCITKEYADPVDILTRSWRKTVRDAARENIVGSATAILALLRGDELRIAHLGDCAFAIVRDGEFIFRSEEQQVSFNYPKQIGTNSPGAAEAAQSDPSWEEERDRVLSEQIREARAAVERLSGAASGRKQNDGPKTVHHELNIHREDLTYATARLAALINEISCQQIPPTDRQGHGMADAHDGKIGSEERGDRPSDAQSFAIKVKKDDIVIMSSDGLVDNLYDEDILEELMKNAKFGPPESTPGTDPSDSSEPRMSSGQTSSHDTTTHGLWSDWSKSMAGLTTPTLGLHDEKDPAASTNSGQNVGPMTDFHPGKAAQSLALAAHSIATDPRAMDSPFGTKAMEQGIYWQGGKRDDVTVIVACIGEAKGH